MKTRIKDLREDKDLTQQELFLILHEPLHHHYHYNFIFLLYNCGIRILQNPLLHQVVKQH